MSIYSTRPFSRIPGVAHKPDKMATANPSSDAIAAPDGRAHSRADKPADWTMRRRAMPVNYMLRPALDWFRQLPLDVRPLSLADKYPRLVNLIVSDWNTPAAFRARIDDLQADRRGGRQGFPAEIRAELNVLRAYYDRSHLALQDERRRRSAPLSQSISRHVTSGRRAARSITRRGSSRPTPP